MNVSNTSHSPRTHFPGVDLLRAIAAALVLVYHVIEVGKIKDWPNSSLTVIFQHGWIGVDLFLVISGFVIALSAFSGVQKQGVGFRRAFAIRRLARIVPLYIVTCVAFLAFIRPQYLFVPVPQLIAHIGSHLLFLHNLYPGTHGSINGPTWSIGLEMQFYLLMMWLSPWLARSHVLRLLLGALVVGALWRFLTTLIWVPGSATPIIQFIYLTQLPGTIDQFAFGIALALAVSKRNEFARRFLAVGWAQFAMWLLVSSVVLSIAAWAMRTYPYWTSTPMLVGWRPLLGAGFAASLAAAITLPLAGSRFLAPLRYLGSVSYGVYLWHMLVLIAIVSWVPGLDSVKFATATIITTLVLASVSWHLIEKPNIDQYKAK